MPFLFVFAYTSLLAQYLSEAQHYVHSDMFLFDLIRLWNIVASIYRQASFCEHLFPPGIFGCISRIYAETPNRCFLTAEYWRNESSEIC